MVEASDQATSLQRLPGVSAGPRGSEAVPGMTGGIMHPACPESTSGYPRRTQEHQEYPCKPTAPIGDKRKNIDGWMDVYGCNSFQLVGWLRG